MLLCPDCGHTFRRQVVNGTAYWLCAAKATNKTDCVWRRVKEDKVYAAFNLMIRKVQANREYLLGTLIRQLEELQYRTTGSQRDPTEKKRHDKPCTYKRSEDRKGEISMMQATSVQPPKTVRIIPATIDTKAAITQSYRQLRVAAYCRVSTKQDEQLNSYEVQRTHYEERIRTEPKWSLVGIFADKGITGTSMKKRDEFNKMLRLCYKGKIDIIIVKSISRFARNTLDVIKITRKL